MLKNLRRRAFVRAAFAAVVAAAMTAASPLTRAADAPLKVGFVFVTPIGDAGWSWQHDQGRQAMQNALGDRIATTVVEGVAEGPDAERVMRDLARQGHGLIFATSFGYLEPALRVAAEFPNVKFEHAGGYKTAANLNTYNARYYEGRYLAGLLAGRASKSGIAGYVAGFPVPEVIQGINAFALGLRAVDPKAEVRVLWLNQWFDPAREREAALTLIRQGADVLTHHSASAAVARVAEDNGVHAIGYHSDMRSVAPRAQLAAVTHHWGGYYTQVASALLAGRWQARPVWGGMKDGMVELSALSPELPKQVAVALQAARAEIVAGRLHPFSGRLVDQAGVVRQQGGTMSDERIATMDWFVQGVVGTLPKN